MNTPICENCGRALTSRSTTSRTQGVRGKPHLIAVVIECGHDDCGQRYVATVSLSDPIAGARPVDGGTRL